MNQQMVHYITRDLFGKFEPPKRCTNNGPVWQKVDHQNLARGRRVQILQVSVQDGIMNRRTLPDSQH